MFEPDHSDLDRDVEASMRMFQKAQVGPVAEITAAKPKRVLVVLDGSGQDESVIAAAVHLQKQLGVELKVLDCGDASERVQKPNWLSDTELLACGEEPAYDEIMKAVDSQSPDLLVVPCPFARDFESVGSDSAGTVIDVLLSRCLIPMLVIRRHDQPLEEATKEIAIVVGSECESEAEAAGWALCLAAPRASLTLSLVIDREQYENIRALMDVITPDKPLEISQLNEAMAESHARLHAAIFKAADSHKLKYRLQPMAYEDAPPSVLSTARPLLVVLPTEADDRYCHGFVQDRIRRSPHPVLVVPQHG